MGTVPYYHDLGDTSEQVMAKDVGKEPTAHAQEDDILIDGDKLKRELRVGQQHIDPAPRKSKKFTISKN